MTFHDLTALGWSDHFADQIDQAEAGAPARITDIHRDRFTALSPDRPLALIASESVGPMAVGDWVLQDGLRILRRLTPTGEIRRAAPHTLLPQMIASNVDTLGIVTSCNNDFNPARIERYLAMALSANAAPLLILTKPDLAEDPRDFLRQAERISPLIVALVINAKNAEDVQRLSPWCGPGKTLALTGSSGVGKTTLRNALTGETEETGDIREDDAKGRHTTRARAMRPIPGGGWLIDTPGIRELALTDAAEAIDTVFADLSDLVTHCRFSDCSHETEPGCAVQAAIASGAIDAARLERWRKLQREESHNSASAALARSRDRVRQKVYNSGKKRGRQKRS